MPGGAEGAGVLCVGRVYCDLVLTGLPRMPSPGTEIYAEGLRLCAGGGAFNTAAYLAALGRSAHLAAILPAPPFDGIVRAAIGQAGLGADLCVAAPAEADAQVTVALVGAGDRAFVSRRSGPAAPPLPDGLARRLGIRHLHIGELATLAAAPWLSEFARGAGLSLSLDCGWDETLATEGLGDLIASVDLFLPNAEEVSWLASHGIHPTGQTIWVEKRGAAGAGLVGSREAAAPSAGVTAIDPTGAGDAFNAGFLDRWLDGSPAADCLAAGNRCGAVAVSVVGGFDIETAPARLAEINA